MMNGWNKPNSIALIVLLLSAWPRANAEAPPDAKPQPALSEDPSQVFTTLALPPERLIALAGADNNLSRIGEALAGLKTVKLGTADAWMLGNVPFTVCAGPAAVVIEQKQPQTLIKASMLAEYVYLLFAVLDLGRESPAQLTILREDGVPTRLKWAPGATIAESAGKLEGKLDPKEDRGVATSMAFEGQAKDGTPVRLFATRWRNDNQWFALTELKFKLLEPKSRFVLLAVSVSNAKK